ncbi:hypothetical protein EVAR_51754_1 [Eumeta japonica]|uniref:Uncharacterized protein n=1 Tax=Eumeta variegata TaxID=151549 RepID=A0A4C1XFA3_EUMVA|nr:hypothetical protein EVAR_51754_1 [Eumeta japonica]
MIGARIDTANGTTAPPAPPPAPHRAASEPRLRQPPIPAQNGIQLAISSRRVSLAAARVGGNRKSTPRGTGWLHKNRLHETRLNRPARPPRDLISEGVAAERLVSARHSGTRGIKDLTLTLSRFWRGAGARGGAAGSVRRLGSARLWPRLMRANRVYRALLLSLTRDEPLGETIRADATARPHPPLYSSTHYGPKSH